MTTPLVAAVLIVKDEAESLPRCLGALRSFVDEVVVYDTGSSDGTPALAESLGARVVRGYWDDDFARARNAAATSARATWVLPVDADEEVQGDPEAFRAALAAAAEDVLPVRVTNLHDDGTSSSFVANKVYRRGRVDYVGPLHEQLRPSSGAATLARVPLSDLEIVHHGYLAASLARKRGRNIRIAERALAASTSSAERTHWTVELARATHLEGDLEVAARLAASATDPTTPAGSRALMYTAWYRHLLGDDTGCLRAVDDLLRSVAPVPRFAHLMAAESWFSLGDKQRALDHLDLVGTAVDRACELPPRAGRVPFLRACCLGILGRHDEAADAALDAARSGPTTLDATYVLVRTWLAAQRDPADAVSDLSEPEAAELAECLRRLDAAKALPFLVALASRPGADPGLAVTAAALAAQDVGLAAAHEEALGRLGASPLDSRATAVTVSGPQRFQAAALAYAVHGDEGRREQLSRCAALVQTWAFEGVLTYLDRLCPEVLPAAVAALSATEERRTAMADLLRRIGESEAAEALLLA